ncbi:MAG: PAS domain S-box protein [Methanocalculus sp.]|uniref:PAS domain-containing protein n=1 Tax=Methanocalculus sp. TaxID=2004547 RepID=UPI0027238860|nr:PAS domain S-box protein [Methanocalculus sp.]MDO9539475.1 PAS domain S-box protein [Methanocalculus sp.]
MPDKPGWVLPALFSAALLSIVISFIALSSGWFIIFQNLYYIPIIIACVYYSWRGFGVSLLLAVSYLLLFSSFTQDPLLIQEAMIRVMIFAAIAGVIATLSTTRDRTEHALREKNEVISAVEEELRQQLEEVTETEKALRESEERYRNVVEDQTEFICRFRPDGTTTFVNEAYCRYFGLSREDILGKMYKPRIYPDDREMVSESFASLSSVNPVVMIDHRIILPDGEVHWQRWSDRAIFDVSGEITEYQSVGRDITRQMIAEEDRRRAYAQIEKNMYQFSILNDQVRNPLAVITGYVDLERGEYADQILHQVNEIDSIISLLDKGVLESASIRSFMERHDQLSDDSSR